MKQILTLLLVFSVGGMTFSFETSKKSTLVLSDFSPLAESKLEPEEGLPSKTILYQFLNQIVLDASVASKLGKIEFKDKGDVQPWISNFASANDAVVWNVESIENSIYELQVELHSVAEVRLQWLLDGVAHHHHFSSSKSDKTSVISLGILQLQTGRHSLTLSAGSNPHHSLEIKSLILKKI